MAVHDPVDPQQRKQLEAYIPGLTESKLSVVQMQNEQKLFIAQMQLKTMGSATKQEFFRLVMLIGGGEPLVAHPLDELYKAEGNSGQNRLVTDFTTALATIGVVKGLWSFLTSADPKADVQTAQGKQNTPESQAAREFIASSCLHHFPRYITGAYDQFSPTNVPRVKREGDAAKYIRAMCETVVQKTRVPIGVYANQLLGAPAADQRSQFVNRPFFGSAFNDGPGAASYFQRT